MQIRKLASIIFVVFSIACKPIIKEVYGVNKNHVFNSASEYLDFFQRTNNIEGKNLLYLDSFSYYKFINQVVKEKLSVYFSSFVNDSTELKKSFFLQENMTCMSRVLSEIKNSSTMWSTTDSGIDTLMKRNVDFKKLGLYYLSGQGPFYISNHPKQLNAFLLYSTNLGKIFKKDFKEIKKYVEENKEFVQLYFISIDKCYDLK